MDFFVILLSTALVNNFALTQLLGASAFLGAANKREAAMDMSAATTLVVTLTSIGSYLVHAWILAPLGLHFLRAMAFILVIAAAVPCVRLCAARTSPRLHRAMGDFLPLIIANSAVLGAALQCTDKAHSLGQAALYGVGAALGFSLALVLFAGLRERLAAAPVPAPFKGAALGMITAGLMSLAFMGFAGLV